VYGRPRNTAANKRSPSHAQRAAAESGKLETSDYDVYRETVKQVYAATIGTETPKYETEAIKRLLARGLVNVEKVETKAAGRVYPAEHPSGLLMKACETCGYKYGSGWMYQEVPVGVRELLQSLPETDIQPAWI
jgi:hypothetical protein